MPDTVPEPQHDPLDGALVPECDGPRPYDELVVGLMRAWETSRDATERRMAGYTLGQCEWLIREYNNCYDGANPWARSRRRR